MKPKSKANKQNAPTTVGSGDLLGEKCLNPNCSRMAYKWALCKRCYYTARKLATHGRITLKELEENGKIKISHNAKQSTVAWLLSPNAAGEPPATKTRE
jgi:hypothetical protein